MEDTFSYGSMAKHMRDMVETSPGYGSIEELVVGILQVAREWPNNRLMISAVAPKAMLRCEGGLTARMTVVRTSRPLGWSKESQSIDMTGIKLACILGVNAHEREQKQNVVIDISIETEDPAEMSACERVLMGELEREEGNLLWRRMVRQVCETIEATEFELVEALATKVAMVCFDWAPVPRVRVKVEKPSALVEVEGAGVEIVREKAWFEGLRDAAVKEK